MNDAAILFIIGAVIGGVVAALVTNVVVRSTSLQSEAALKAERDSAQQTVKERDAAVADLKASLAAAFQRSDERGDRITALESEKGRLSGELLAVETLHAQIDANEKSLNTSRQLVIELESSKSELEERVRSAETGKIEAIAEKERHLKTTLDAQAISYRNLLAEKDAALAAVMQEKERAVEDQKRLLADSERILSEKFSALSLESLKAASEDFLRLANERFEKVGEVSNAEMEKRRQAIDDLLKPVAETLDKLSKQHLEMEEKRVSAFDSIEKGIKTLSSEADQLANALRKPTSRGAWGEMNLQVILENAGLVLGEGFIMQDSTTEDEDGRARTDVLVMLPQGRQLIIDSKTPLESFWEGMNSDDEATRKVCFARHARLVRDHVKALSSKSYWTRYTSAPDFTIMFLPTEGAYQAALESDPALIAEAHRSRVYITGPMNLMSMVHAIAFVLREERLAQNAQQVQETAAELYRRIAKFLEHVDKLGRNLRLTVENFNSAVGSLDTRVLPIARKMNNLGIGGGADLADSGQVEALPRSLVSQDHLSLPEAAVVELSAGDILEGSLGG